MSRKHNGSIQHKQLSPMITQQSPKNEIAANNLQDNLFLIHIVKENAKDKS